jgi:NitT/TauT family transport system substrate-binding protein
MVPQSTMKFARFMHSAGTLKVASVSWRDYFFPEIHDVDGS